MLKLCFVLSGSPYVYGTLIHKICIEKIIYANIRFKYVYTLGH